MIYKSTMGFLLLATTLVCLVMPVVVEGCTSPTQPQNLCTCQNTTSISIKLLDCRFKNLTAIPSFASNSDNILFDLLLSSPEGHSANNNITTIGANAFQNIRVRKIDLLGNKLRTVDNYAFTNSANIKEILIEGDNNPAPFDALNAVRNLTKLHLKNFQHATITPGQLAFPYLQTLILENINGLSSLQPDAFNPLQNLQEFEILNPTGTWNPFPVPVLNNLWNLKQLKLRGLILAATSTSIYAGSFNALSKLETLYITDMINLRSIDSGAFGNASRSLTHLYINYNNEIRNLNFLNAEQWPSLEQLDLSYNLQIGSIISTTNFSTLSVLRVLQLQDIGLTSVNTGMFADLRKLHTLDLGYNKISSIGPQAFSNMANLTELILTDQQKTTINIHANAFVGIENSLKHLLLNTNIFNYSTFWTILLPSLTQLTELNLVNTALNVIPDYAFRYNNKLEKIYLAENILTMVKQESFYGPKTTLKEVHLNGNQLTTLDACVFSDFPTKPKFFISNNKLHCDCHLLWLLQWITQDRDQNTFVEVYIGPCISPQNLSNRYLYKDIKEFELCQGGGGTLPQCPNLYTTTTVRTTSTTTTSTPPSTTTTLPPIPRFQLFLGHADYTNIDLIWTVDDKTDVTGFKLEMVTNNQGTISKDIAASEKQGRFFDLQSGQFYYICLYVQIKNVLITNVKSCISANTLQPVVSSTAPSTVKPESQNQLPVIIGASVGGLVLLVIIILIIFVLLKANKQKKQPPPTTGVSFTMHPHATIPQAGGTAKRFAKKSEKEGASPDDISVTVISNGEMNKDRISAGSYQFLNEKGIDKRPMPSTSTSHRLPQTDKYNRPVQANGASSSRPDDHYMNNVDDRPLPKAPGGTKGFANHGYKTSKEHLPETSKNEYSEVRY